MDGSKFDDDSNYVTYIKGEYNVISYASAANFEELSSYIIEKCTLMKPLAAQWADLARKAIQGLPYNGQRLAELETHINILRPELRRAALVASEHFTEEQLNMLKKQASISKHGWRVLKKPDRVTLKNGFTLVIY